MNGPPTLLRRTMDLFSSRAKKQAQKRLNEFENEATPLEYLDIMKDESDDGLGLIAKSTKTANFLSRVDAPQAFRREQIASGAFLYRMDDAIRPLLVVFTGRTKRPMLPVPAFLQFFDSHDWNVLMLRDERRLHYRDGVEGFASSMADLAPKVRDLAGKNVDVLALGTSMGGLPAIRLQLFGGADRAISICGRFPADAQLLLSAQTVPDPFDPICACLDQKERPLLFVHPAGSVTDAQEAALAARLTGGHTWAVPSTESHGLLGQLWEKGRMSEIFPGILDFCNETLGHP